MNDQLKKYYRGIRRCLPCPGKLKRQIMDRITQAVSAYLEENPEADFEAVQQHFGTPQQIAADYIEEMTTPEILKKFKVKRTVIGIVCGAVALALVMWGIVLISAWVDAQKSFDGFYDVGTVIESDVEEYE